jgi:hypothetical protein
VLYLALDRRESTMPTFALPRRTAAAAVALAFSIGPALAAPESADANPFASRIDAVIAARPKDNAPVPANLPNAALWGPYARIGGTFWYDRAAGSLKEYQWKLPGEQLLLTETTVDAQRQSTLHLNAFGDGILFNNGVENVAIAVPRPDVIVQPHGVTSRLVNRYVGDRRVMQMQELRNGQWIEVGAPGEMVRLSRAQGEAVRAMLEQERQVRQAQRSAAQEATMRADEQVFGVLARAAGNWRGEDGAVFVVTRPKDKQYYGATWFGPGGTTSTYTVSQGNGQLTGSRNTSDGVSEEASKVARLDDGAVMLAFGWLDSTTDRAFFIRDGKLQLAEGSGDGGRFVPEGRTFFSGTRMSDQEAAAFFVQRQAADRAQAAAQAAAAKEDDSDSGFSLLGTLAVVGGGLAAVAANGGNATQAVGAVMQSVAMANPESAMATTLAQQGQGLITGKGAGATAMVPGVTGAGSYATRPNMLAPSTCPGFTEANYRQKALSGGPDTQLATMCGQAFEYYTMYKRAIAQGYAEADANRTYQAHAQSAQVANSFARDAR